MQINKNEDTSGLITEKKFRELASVHAPHCFTIIIPTSRAGEEVDSRQLQKRYKNSLKELKSICEKKGLKNKEIVKYLEPLETLLEDVHFWRNQSDGLAVFMQEDIMECFTLPGEYKETIYLADHYYLLPLIPLFNDNGIFYLLSISLGKVNFFEGSRHDIAEIVIDDLVPGRLEDAVGYDYEDSSLQHRGGQEGGGTAMYHGQGAGKDDKKDEIKKFFRAVDKGLMNILNEEDAPLVLACVDHYYPVYREVTNYNHLFDEYIGGNPDEEDPILLHEKAWMILEKHFRQERETRTERYRDSSSGGKTSADPEKIIPAAVDGRIDTLFLQKDSDQYGYYDPETRDIIEHEESDSRVSLFNLAAMNTLDNGGQVYLSDPDEMPVADTEINALFRY
ncbi:MAG: hypothetical protein U5K32_08980 [Bacteroidales bacterium]|nr:hypothetical protein [Bacteroidales bacterium]